VDKGEAFRYPTEGDKVTIEHLQTLRSLAIEREKNRDIAKYAVLNVQFGVEALSSYLSGDVQLQSYSQTSTRRAVFVRKRWSQAITKVCTALMASPSDLSRPFIIT
jgi:hypothetical protein